MDLTAETRAKLLRHLHETYGVTFVNEPKLDIGGYRVAVFRRGYFWHGDDLKRTLGDDPAKLRDLIAAYWHRTITRDVTGLLAHDHGIETFTHQFEWALVIHHSIHAHVDALPQLHWPPTAKFLTDDLMPPYQSALLAPGAIQIKFDVPATKHPAGIRLVRKPAVGVSDYLNYAIHINSGKVRKIHGP